MAWHQNRTNEDIFHRRIYVSLGLNGLFKGQHFTARLSFSSMNACELESQLWMPFDVWLFHPSDLLVKENIDTENMTSLTWIGSQASDVAEDKTNAHRCVDFTQRHKVYGDYRFHHD